MSCTPIHQKLMIESAGCHPTLSLAAAAAVAAAKVSAAIAAAAMFSAMVIPIEHRPKRHCCDHDTAGFNLSQPRPQGCSSRHTRLRAAQVGQLAALPPRRPPPNPRAPARPAPMPPWLLFPLL